MTRSSTESEGACELEAAPSLPSPGEEYVGRAWEMVPELVAGQAATEQRTFYSKATHESFKNAGFYRLRVPRHFGGLEVEIETFFKVVVALSSGCPSKGWQFCFGALHAVTVGSLFDQAAQEALFGNGHFVCAATVKPRGKAHIARLLRYFRDMAMARSHAYNTQIDGMARHLSDELLGKLEDSSGDVFNVKQ